MKAKTQYTDLEGTVAADFSDFFLLGSSHRFDIRDGFFNIDKEIYEVIAIDINGLESDNFSLALICIDKQKSTNEKKHYTQISVSQNHKLELSDIFKRLNIVLFDSGEYAHKNIEINDYIDEDYELNEEHE